MYVSLLCVHPLIQPLDTAAHRVKGLILFQLIGSRFGPEGSKMVAKKVVGGEKGGFYKVLSITVSGTESQRLGVFPTSATDLLGDSEQDSVPLCFPFYHSYLYYKVSGVVILIWLDSTMWPRYFSSLLVMTILKLNLMRILSLPLFFLFVGAFLFYLHAFGCFSALVILLLANSLKILNAGTKESRWIIAANQNRTTCIITVGWLENDHTVIMENPG